MIIWVIHPVRTYQGIFTGLLSEQKLSVYNSNFYIHLMAEKKKPVLLGKQWHILQAAINILSITPMTLYSNF